MENYSITNYNIKDLQNIYRRGKSWIYENVKSGSIPSPIKTGRGSTWIKSEVDRDIQKRKDARSQEVKL